ncbi:hypothetical protein M1146_07040, partial [Patescibacteria group bacterium]|nr:hypothetical protein [Patescibacteria group bacterium]
MKLFSFPFSFPSFCVVCSNVLGCGYYSYAALTEKYNLILGVTGTLASLTPEERLVVDSFNINRVAYLPSIYGQGFQLNNG